MEIPLDFLAKAASFTKGDLEHQNQAFNFVQSKLSQEEMQQFMTMFRNNPNNITYKHFLKDFPIISQRDFEGDGDRDGVLDKWQTCNIHCCHMVIKYLTGKTVSPKQLDYDVRSKFGSRYVHSNLVRLLAMYGVRSTFDVSTTHAEMKAHLKNGNPIIWSNLLTHSGHLVCITGFDDDNNFYQIHDPYGEPSPRNPERTKWQYQDVRKPYNLSYSSFDTVNANGYNYYKKEHWAHLCQKVASSK